MQTTTFGSVLPCSMSQSSTVLSDLTGCTLSSAIHARIMRIATLAAAESFLLPALDMLPSSDMTPVGTSTLIDEPASSSSM
ncbi:Uncharacterised protein [uncultured archaeon]|nr:Uncharacterised protein [uncultured archaeon]